MIPRELYRLLQCPTCGSRNLYITDAAVHCAACGRDLLRVAHVVFVEGSGLRELWEGI